MSLARNIIAERIQAFLDACERRNVRVTHQRLEIYREVAASEEHPDVDAIYRRVKKRIPMVSLDTVYRNLNLLSDFGLISIVGLSQERLRFDANMQPHQHFVCVKCGIIRDFSSDLLSGLQMPDEARTLGESLSLHFEVKGICKRCQPCKQKS